MDEDPTFGALLRARREALGLTRAELGRRAGCSEELVKKIERDERRPSREVAALLARHLLVPAAEHEAFLELSRGRRVAPPAQGPAPPPFLRAAPARAGDQPAFVARAAELAALDGQLAAALDRRGSAVFITGSAGSGKSSLARVFAERAQARHGALVVARGACNAHVGAGDPYLPFREILDLLTGAVEPHYEAGALGREAALRLWGALPNALGAVLDHGPDLVGTFLSAAGLAGRVEAAQAAGAPLGPAAARLAALAGRPPPAPESLRQLDLFAQYTRALQAIAEARPLLLVLDDLHWADDGSLGLLFHLGRRLGGRRILVVGCYRPDDLAASEGRHPLEPVVNELQRQYGAPAVDLARADRREFVDQLVDSEPNRLGPAFREALHRQTGGHALFTVEMLRGMQERGVLVRDAGGAWVEAAGAAWQALPARVEGVIRERLGRLPPALAELLKVASVEGETFTIEVLAAVQRADPLATVRLVSERLVAGHRLVRAEGGRQAGARRLIQYRFGHSLFQTYLYGAIDPSERAALHQAVGEALEGLYGEHAAAIAPQLARHFLEAGLPGRAAPYLAQAADRARQLFALVEALRYYDSAVAVAELTPGSTPPHALRELRERRGLARAQAAEFDGAIEDLSEALAAARALGEDRHGRELLIALGMAYRRADDYERAGRCLDEALGMARAAGDEAGTADALYHLGTVLWSVGDNARAGELHGEAVAICRRLGLADAVAMQATHGWGESLAARGLQREAVAAYEESLALARALGDRSYEAENLQMLGFSLASFMGLGEYGRALEALDASLAISRDAHLDWHTAFTLAGRGLTRGHLGDYAAGVADMEAALAVRPGAEAARAHAMTLDLLGDLYQEQGEAGRARELRRRALEAQNAGLFWWPRILANDAIARLRLGDLSVGPDLASALALARERAQAFHATRCLEGLAELALARGEPQAALGYADELLALAEAGDLAETRAWARYWRGRALALAAPFGEAAADLAAAAAWAEGVGRLRLAVDVREALAALWAGAGRPAEAAAHEAAAGAARARIKPSG